MRGYSRSQRVRDRESKVRIATLLMGHFPLPSSLCCAFRTNGVSLPCRHQPQQAPIEQFRPVREGQREHGKRREPDKRPLPLTDDQRSGFWPLWERKRTLTRERMGENEMRTVLSTAILAGRPSRLEGGRGVNNQPLRLSKQRLKTVGRNFACGSSDLSEGEGAA